MKRCIFLCVILLSCFCIKMTIFASDSSGLKYPDSISNDAEEYSLSISSLIDEEYSNLDAVSSDKTGRIYVFTSYDNVEKYSKLLPEKYNTEKIVCIGNSSYNDMFFDTSPYKTMVFIADVLVVVVYILLFIFIIKRRKKKTKRKMGITAAVIISVFALSFMNTAYGEETYISIEQAKELYDNGKYPDGIVYVDIVYTEDKDVSYDIYYNTLNTNNIIDFLDEFSIEELKSVKLKDYPGLKSSLIKQLESEDNDNSNSNVHEVVYIQDDIKYWIECAFGHFLLISVAFGIVLLVYYRCI